MTTPPPLGSGPAAAHVAGFDVAGGPSALDDGGLALVLISQ